MGNFLVLGHLEGSVQCMECEVCNHRLNSKLFFRITQWERKEVWVGIYFSAWICFSFFLLTYIDSSIPGNLRQVHFFMHTVTCAKGEGKEMEDPL